MFLRVAASFALVGLMLWIFARAGAGRLGALIGGPGRRNDEDPLDVVDRRQLTKSTGVAVLRAGERYFLVGVSEQGVQMLAEGDDLLLPDSPPQTGSLDLTARDAESVGAGPAPDSSSRHSNSQKSSSRHSSSRKSSSAKPDRASARTRSPRAEAPNPARMNPFIALREKTVRRS